MGSFGALRDLLDAEQLRELEEDFERFRQRTGSEDPDLFVQYLAQQGLLSQDQLIAALKTSGRPEITEVESLLARFDDTGRNAQRTFATMSPEGTYALLAPLGEGAMGSVHVAKDHDLKRKVAYKEISGALAGDPALIRRFLHEVQITAQLDHPSVIPVYGLEVSREGRFGYAMKLVEGRTLQDVIDTARDAHAHGRAPDESLVVARIEPFLKVCDALAYAHSRGVIHRDLKPQNIMVGRYGEVYVMDWGLARLLGSPDDPLAANRPGGLGTQMGHAVGTPAYMSPEQAQGRNDELGPASDQYALGLILQELVTLKPAIDGATGQAVIDRASRGERNPMVGPGRQRVPAELAAIVRRACAPRPQERYPDVSALAEDVRRYVSGRAPLAYREGWLARAGRLVQRHREVFLIVVLALLAGAASLAVLSLLGLQTQLLASRQREEKLAGVLTTAGSQAHLVDAELQRYERLLEAAASTAVTVLSETEPEVDTPLYLASDFDEPSRSPPDLAASTRYGMPVSFEHPSIVLAPGVDRAGVEEDLRRLVRVRSPFKRLMLRTGHDGSLALQTAQVREVLGERGVPVAWMYVGTASGVQLGYPGRGNLPPGFDPRTRPWYTLSADKRGIHWGNPYLDANGLGLTLPASTALYDTEGTFLGVAGIDLTFDYILSTLLASPLPGAAEIYLLDEQGRVVVRSGDRGDAEGRRVGPDGALTLEAFPLPEVVDTVRERRSGYALSDGDLVVFFRLHATGWYYVIRGAESELLGG